MGTAGLKTRGYVRRTPPTRRSPGSSDPGIPAPAILAACVLLTLALAAPGHAAWQEIPPPLPAPSGRIVNVATVAELNAAVAGLTSGTTILIAPGTYQLTRTLAIHGPLEDVAIRGASDNRADVVLVGAGRDNPAVSHGIWAGGDVRRLTIANLTVRDVYYHAIALNPGPQAPRIYNVHLRDSGEQLLKTNPNADGTGIDDGVIEYSVFEYVPRSRNWYANAIQVLAGRNWVIRHNLIRGIRAPDGEMAGPAVLAWFSASGTIVEANTFVNCQREIAFGLIDRTPNDHTGGVIRNNFIYRDATVAGGDVAIGVFDSPGTKVLHNTILTLDGYPNDVEYRFAATRDVVIANNLVSGSIASREGATAAVTGNVSAAPEMFVDAAAGDLHLVATATAAIGQATPLAEVTTDWDDHTRPVGTGADVGADEFRAPPAAPRSVRVVSPP